jgi:hypothetical protein
LLSNANVSVLGLPTNAKPKFDAGVVSQPWTTVVTSTVTNVLVPPAGTVTIVGPSVGAVAAVMVDSLHALVTVLKSKAPGVATLSTNSTRVACDTLAAVVPGGFTASMSNLTKEIPPDCTTRLTRVP